MDSVQTPPQQQAQAQSSLPEAPEAVSQVPVGRDRIRALSLTFGHIPGVEIFSEWKTRKQCSDTGVHRSIMAGICGNKRYGAYSIALSGQYDDDEDGGNVIIYTGSGGRQKWSNGDPPKRLMFGPQIADQSWDDTKNGALLLSCSTGEPIRVIRSSKLPSKYAPQQGYRYDGLYTVASCWTAMGKKGFRICRCRLQRLPDQPLIPERPFTVSASRRRHTQHRYSPLTSSSPSRPTNVPSRVSAYVGLNQSSPAPAQNALGESTESPGWPQGHAMSEILTLLEQELSNMSHEESPSPQPQVSAKLDALLHEHDVNNDTKNAKEGEDERRGDDVTLVPSEDDRTDAPEAGYNSDVQM